MRDADIATVQRALEIQTRYYEAINLPDVPQEEREALTALARLESRLVAAEKALSLVYRYDSVATAESCDEVDKRGVLLGRVRALAGKDAG